MLGTGWRVSAAVGMLAVALTGCGVLSGGGEVTKTPDPRVEENAKKEREDLLEKAYQADIEANTARDRAAIHCKPLTSFKDLASQKCRAEAERTDLFNKSQACLKAVDAYNGRRGQDGQLVRFKSSNPKRNGQVVTCGFDNN